MDRLTNLEKLALKAIAHVFDPKITTVLSVNKADQLLAFLRQYIERDTPEARSLERNAGKLWWCDTMEEVSDSDQGEDLEVSDLGQEEDSEESDDSFVVSDDHIDYDTDYEDYMARRSACRRARRDTRVATKRKAVHCLDSDTEGTPRRVRRALQNEESEGSDSEVAERRLLQEIKCKVSDPASDS